ncbi:MAG: outer membrane beta-barrel protein [Sinobacterium sp.]|nr:outer membrane beta-barrel protein [Sinobacterium sp.]
MFQHRNSVKKWLVTIALIASFLQATHAEDKGREQIEKNSPADNSSQSEEGNQIEEEGQTEGDDRAEEGEQPKGDDQISYFYIGGKLGLNIYQHSCESWSTSCDKEDFAAGVFAGYQFNNMFALEMTYLDLGDATATYMQNTTQQKYTGSMTGIDLSGLAYLNISDDFSAFARAGIFHWQGENSGPYHQRKANGFSPTIGAGLAYQLSERWQVRAAYQYFHGLGDDEIGGTNANLATIGISYQFKPETITVIETADITLEKVTFAVLFDFDKSKIVQPESLNAVVNRLTLYPQATVSLTAYSDTKGSVKYNFKLSERRLKSVHQYLIDRGVNKDQITSKNLGSSASVIDNNSEEHRHLNRLVQVLLPAVTIPSSQEQK